MRRQSVIAWQALPVPPGKRGGAAFTAGWAAVCVPRTLHGYGGTASGGRRRYDRGTVLAGDPVPMHAMNDARRLHAGRAGENRLAGGGTRACARDAAAEPRGNKAGLHDVEDRALGVLTAGGVAML